LAPVHPFPTRRSSDLTGAVSPADNLATATDQQSGIKTFPMAGTPNPPQQSMAQYLVFVQNGQTVDEFPTNVRGRIALVRLTTPRSEEHTSELQSPYDL